mmetsp:Transcript_13098/g.21812  ORF Transcript_13098/g.21812 Transcript_13098/m.21812 type:complete len:497 (-) Transcript_13098:345-1835(-)
MQAKTDEHQDTRSEVPVGVQVKEKEDLKMRGGSGETGARARKRRATCKRCRRVTKVCICDVLPEEKIRIGVDVIIVQHPDEAARVQVCSVPIIGAVVEDCKVIVGKWFPPGYSQDLDRALNQPEGTVILYPGDGSLPIEDFHLAKTAAEPTSTTKGQTKTTTAKADGELKKSKPRREEGGGKETKDEQRGRHEWRGVKTLILVDGTWRHAKLILNKNPRLTAPPVQRVHCSAFGKSEFIFRREPRAGFVSTLGALCHALSQLDEALFDDAVKAMMQGFRKMVRIQLSYIPQAAREELIRDAERKGLRVSSPLLSASASSSVSLPSGAAPAPPLASPNHQGKGGPVEKVKEGDDNSSYWAGDAEEEIRALIRSYQSKQKSAIKNDLQAADTETRKEKKMNVDKSRHPKDIIRDKVTEWSLCETLLDLKNRQSYRELKRLENVNWHVAITVSKLANRTKSRGNRTCVLATNYLQQISPEALLPDKHMSGEYWKNTVNI